MKTVNRYTSNEFHDWQREHLPGIVIQDIDAWALVISEPTSYRPIALIELKRSTESPERWHPYANDRPNYASLVALARAAGIPLYIVYHQKNKAIEDDDLFHVFWLKGTRPDYHGRHRLVRAADFAHHFPQMFWSA